MEGKQDKEYIYDDKNICLLERGEILYARQLASRLRFLTSFEIICRVLHGYRQLLCILNYSWVYAFIILFNP